MQVQDAQRVAGGRHGTGDDRPEPRRQPEVGLECPDGRRRVGVHRVDDGAEPRVEAVEPLGLAVLLDLESVTEQLDRRVVGRHGGNDPRLARLGVEPEQLPQGVALLVDAVEPLGRAVLLDLESVLDPLETRCQLVEVEQGLLERLLAGLELSARLVGDALGLEADLRGHRATACGSLDVILGLLNDTHRPQPRLVRGVLGGGEPGDDALLDGGRQLLEPPPHVVLLGLERLDPLVERAGDDPHQSLDRVGRLHAERVQEVGTSADGPLTGRTGGASAVVLLIGHCDLSFRRETRYLRALTSDCGLSSWRQSFHRTSGPLKQRIATS